MWIHVCFQCQALELRDISDKQNKPHVFQKKMLALMFEHDFSYDMNLFEAFQ